MPDTKNSNTSEATPRFLRRPLFFLLHYVRRRPFHFAGLFLLVIGAAACAIGVQVGMKFLVDAMSAPERNRLAVWGPLALFITLVGVEHGLWRLSGWLGCRTMVSTGVDVRLDLFQHLSGHSMCYFNDRMAGSLGNRISETAAATGTLFSVLAWNMVPPCTDFLGAMIVLGTVHGDMAALLCVFVAIVGGGMILFGRRGQPIHRHYAEQCSRANGELVDVVGNIWAVKAFSTRQRERERLAEHLGLEAESQRRSWMYQEKTRVLHDLLLWLMAGTILAWALQLWAENRITPGEVVLVSTLTFRILHGSRDLAFALFGTTQQLGLIAETLRDIGKPHSVTDCPRAKPFVPQGGAIKFENVCFGYANGDLLFRDLGLDIPAGQRLGIIGPSGAGKSTLVSLVQRLDDVHTGSILIDGRCVTEIPQDALRAAIAVVPQDISLFHRSILDNIRYGRSEASDEEVYAAARQAFCDAFIRALPEGYHTLVGERGVKLSGGQRQRIGIARAFLKNAPILILDEATSALDTASELEIHQALAKLMRGRTVLAVAHRLSTVASFDRIIVLSEGCIVEDGSPEELRRRRGVFDAMWQLQAGNAVSQNPKITPAARA
ncbi:ABC transporter ATP-binding protein [Methylocaldum sp. 14B]|uniref:ABC transporter ATP-binding protein n=1 Tax=Methylocaldum sp. 14B TaxID=1912213 RepID=UPI000989B9AA|nr:ABC transporter ATP-binding protein [Methylocaldum sp. 14B]